MLQNTTNCFCRSHMGGLQHSLGRWCNCPHSSPSTCAAGTPSRTRGGPLPRHISRANHTLNLQVTWCPKNLHANWKKYPLPTTKQKKKNRVHKIKNAVQCRKFLKQRKGESLHKWKKWIINLVTKRCKRAVNNARMRTHSKKGFPLKLQKKKASRAEDSTF